MRGDRAHNEREEPPPAPLLRRLPRGKLISLDSASAAPSRSFEVAAYCTTPPGCALTRPWLTCPPHGVDRRGSPASPPFLVVSPGGTAGYAWRGGDRGIPAQWLAVATEDGVRADDPRRLDVRRQ